MGKFILLTNDGHWHFTLLAGNNEPILQSEIYNAKQNALRGIESVRTNSRRKDAFEIKTAKNDHRYFVLKSSNNKIIGQSQLYAKLSGCKNGMASVEENAKYADIITEGVSATP